MLKMPLIDYLHLYASCLPSGLLSTPEEPGLLKIWSSTFWDMFRLPLTLFETQESFRRNEGLGNLPTAKVLMSFGQLKAAPFYFFGEVAGINNHCHFQGYQTSWVIKAKKEDLESALLDETIQSLVTFGHGSRSSLEMHDGVITTREITEIYGERTKKRGFWIQYSCGSPEGLPLGFSVMENPQESCLFYPRDVNSFHRQHLGIPHQNLKSFLI